ncbi:MAG: hypothetical protein QOF94_2157 [Acidobacteriaceae bacterium]
MELEHIFAPQLATIALIGFGGISEPVTQNNLTVIQRGLNHLCNVLRSRSKHQSHFRRWRKALGSRVQQYAANFFSGRCPTRLARFHHFMSGRTQRPRQLPQLRALAGPVQPFEGDELPAPRHRGDDISAGHPCTAALAACYSLKFCKAVDSIHNFRGHPT